MSPSTRKQSRWQGKVWLWVASPGVSEGWCRPLESLFSFSVLVSGIGEALSIVVSTTVLLLGGGHVVRAVTELASSKQRTSNEPVRIALLVVTDGFGTLAIASHNQ